MTHDPTTAEAFLAISGSAGLRYALGGAFNKQHMYYLYTFAQNMLQVDLLDCTECINEAMMSKELGDLDNRPVFDSTKPDIVSLYRSLFARLGSYIIVGATYGTRLSLVSHTHFTKAS